MAQIAHFYNKNCSCGCVMLLDPWMSLLDHCIGSGKGCNRLDHFLPPPPLDLGKPGKLWTLFFLGGFPGYLGFFGFSGHRLLVFRGFPGFSGVFQGFPGFPGVDFGLFGFSGN